MNVTISDDDFLKISIFICKRTRIRIEKHYDKSNHLIHHYLIDKTFPGEKEKPLDITEETFNIIKKLLI